MTRVFDRFFYRIAVSIFCCSLACSWGAGQDATRFEKEVTELEERARERGISKGGIVCVGSSSMRMWTPRIEQDLAPLSVVPMGFGGSQFSDAIHYFDRLVAAYEPRAVLVYEGDNDVAKGKTPVVVARDFLDFVRLCHEQNSEMRVYVISIKPSIARASVWPQAVKANAMLKAICEEDERLNFIDVAHALIGRDGVAKERYFVEDGIHLNDLGYDRWARAVRKVIVPNEIDFE
ncbi:GDSL-type esterase/lipase family protein [Pelagicoccus mobilis]|uniref:SGNH hydrolase-type esterase domain-containing protein n=1 Tax=Pelagicoccus mobilis TaxID=415221 RepID=A0A934RZP7_9BACT|nr:GDSL-type esterase/lipase family protein [Pelagicoccus mobilis]MBK1878505.1 hypothetical protein [Pelagicoccus mobilis]